MAGKPARIPGRLPQGDRALPSRTGDTCYPEYAELPHGYNLGVLYFKDEKYDHVIKFVNSVFAENPDITHKLNAPLTALIQDPESKAILGGVYTYEARPCT